MEAMRQTINALSAENARLKDEAATSTYTTDTLKVEKVRDYVKTIKAYETDMVKVVTDILYLIGEK